MSEELKYQCEKCGNIKISKGGSIPKCCGIPMKNIPLDICLQPAHAEHARPMNDEDACDDFRAGQ
jgi:hypothetical protein